MRRGRPSTPIGAVLAGGAGRRLGGDKAIVELAGRPLAAYPAAALRSVLDEVVIVVKVDTALPDLPYVTGVWVESPKAPQHPLTGIIHALQTADGRPVLACAVDLPLMSVTVLRALLETPPGKAPAVVPRAAGRLQPLCALYLPAALPALSGHPENVRTVDVVEALTPKVIDVDDDDAFLNVNRPEDLLHASALLATRR